MRIGICTGGGDVPGLNPCIKAVVTRVADGGHDVIGIRRGWAGLLETDPDDPESAAANTVPLTSNAVRTIGRGKAPGLADVERRPRGTVSIGRGRGEAGRNAS